MSQSQQFDNFVTGVLDLKKGTHLTQAWREKSPQEREAIRNLYLGRIPDVSSATTIFQASNTPDSPHL